MIFIAYVRININLAYNWSTRPDILLLYCISFNHGICVSCLAFWPYCRTGFSVGSATEKVDVDNSSKHETRCHSHAHYRTFKHYESVAKRSLNSFTDKSSSAVFPASITSSLWETWFTHYRWI